MSEPSCKIAIVSCFRLSISRTLFNIWYKDAAITRINMSCPELQPSPILNQHSI